MTTLKRWLSPHPGSCEVCEEPIQKVFYDAKTKQGPWACMCKTCFTLGPGIGKLGMGYGQEYMEDPTTNHWIKTGG